MLMLFCKEWERNEGILNDKTNIISTEIEMLKHSGLVHRVTE